MQECQSWERAQVKRPSNRAPFRASRIERSIERSRKSSLKAKSPGLGLTTEIEIDACSNGNFRIGYGLA